MSKILFERPSLSDAEQNLVDEQILSKTKALESRDRLAEEIVAEDRFADYNPKTREISFSYNERGPGGSRYSVVFDCGTNFFLTNTPGSKSITVQGYDFKVGDMPVTTSLWKKYCE